MKTRFTLAILILSTCFTLQAQNLIENGDFENWKRTGANPASWQTSFNKESATFEYTKDKKQGNYVRLKEMNPEGPKARRFQNTTDINIAAAGSYEVSFKVKGKVGLRAVVLARKGENPVTNAASPTNHFYSFSKTYPANTEVAEWTEVVATIVVPETASFGPDYRLHISWSDHRLTAPACDFYIDDVKLIKIN
ncbi:MAG: hypothetical protein RBT57_01565 [Paludibacter sp.]|jgi:hypothetical protein|nr:hypothetical protein [Paludibacter sp.]